MAQQTELLTNKGKDYSRDFDRLLNFKTAADEYGLRPLQAWALFMKKHFDTIGAFVRTGQLQSEPIRGRLLDLANYCILGAALIEEPKDE